MVPVRSGPEALYSPFVNLSATEFLSIAYLAREGYTHAYIGMSYSIIVALSEYV